MQFEHPSGLPFAFQRADGDPSVQEVVTYGRRPFIQSTDLHDMQAIQRSRARRLGRLIAADGDRVSGAEAVVNMDAGTVSLTAGRIYADGDVFPVDDAVLTDVPMDGRFSIGVRLARSWVTGADDPNLLGLVPGSLAQGEDGSAREIVTLSWARADDDGEGQFYQVYLLENGTVLDQTPPPMLDGIAQALAAYDRPHGSYIVSGCRVQALGPASGSQVFSIEEGEANIDGIKKTRYTALRYSEPEDWDIAAVPGETHTFTGGASREIFLNRGPIDSITTVLLDKQKTVTIVRGPVANGADALPDGSVVSVSLVQQGGTTYVAGTSFNLVSGSIDWAPAGVEPAPGTSYVVTYRYRDAITPDEVRARSIVVSGGVSGGDVIVSYTWKLPRVDLLCLNTAGAAVYVYGVSALANPRPPIAPGNLLALCEVHNDWTGAPRIISDGVRTGVRMPNWSLVWRYFNAIEDQNRLIQQERLKSNVDQRDPSAKRNMFVDPFIDDSFRDVGEAQSGAVGMGVLQLAIDPTFYDIVLDGPVTLEWVEEVIVEQVLKTGCMKINPFQNHLPLAAALVLNPAVDFWTEAQTQWASPRTIEFNRGVQFGGGPLQTTVSTNEMVSSTERVLPFLRVRNVGFKIEGFYAGEILESLTFDGIDVTPGGTPTADSDGVIEGSFAIPANVPAGSKMVRAEGMGGTTAEAMFTGQGTLTIDVMRRTTTITRWVAPPPQSVGGGDGDGGVTGMYSDPQAQIFNLPRTRQLVGVDFHLCVRGDQDKHVLVHQVGVDNGFPTTEIQAEGFVSMVGAPLGWTSARYGLPVTVPAMQDRAFVIKTDDGDHSVSLARLGDFDASLQQPVTVHPYPIGPRLDSVNSRTWTAHQAEALTFRLVAARYTSTTRTVDLGSVDLAGCSDLQVRAVVDLPSADCSVVFEIERPGGVIYRLLPFQVLQLPTYITETVQLRAVLKGTEHLSPVLFPVVEVIAGEIATEATYVSQVIDITDAVRVSAYLKTSIPPGASVAMQYDHVGDGWKSLPLHDTEISPDPRWVEQNFRKDGLSANGLRLKITLTGGPSARPMAGDFGAAVM